jgi:hypothetical protein
MRENMRYRMLDVRIWCDEKFRSLTPLKPSGQALFIYLLTNPHTTSIPGLYRAGAGAMAEELAWPLAGFRRALKEVTVQGLVKSDLKARVIFIRNAIKYNKPQSPNVIRSWALHWDEIPECPLKSEAYHILQSFVKGLGKAFAQAFEETLTKQDVKATVKSFTKTCLNQEQEQDKEQEQEEDDELKKAKFNQEDVPTSKCTQDYQVNLSKKIKSEQHISSPINREFLLEIPLYDSAPYYVTKQEYQAWQNIYTEINVLQELRQLLDWNRANPNKRKRRAHILSHIHTWLAKEQRQKMQGLSYPSSFPITFDHNVQVAKKWLAPGSLDRDKYAQSQLLAGKKIL